MSWWFHPPDNLDPASGGLKPYTCDYWPALWRSRLPQLRSLALQPAAALPGSRPASTDANRRCSHSWLAEASGSYDVISPVEASEEGHGQAADAAVPMPGRCRPRLSIPLNTRGRHQLMLMRGWHRRQLA